MDLSRSTLECGLILPNFDDVGIELKLLPSLRIIRNLSFVIRNYPEFLPLMFPLSSYQ